MPQGEWLLLLLLQLPAPCRGMAVMLLALLLLLLLRRMLQLGPPCLSLVEAKLRRSMGENCLRL